MNAHDPQHLRAAMDAVDPVDADVAFAVRAATEGSRRTRRNRAMGVVGGLSALVVVAAATASLWLPSRNAPATMGTPSPTPSVTETRTPSASPTPTPSTVPSASPSSTASPTASGAPGVAVDRLITPHGIGEIRVGMTIEEGIALGIATDQGEICGPWQTTEEGARRYPEVWAYWTDQLHSLAVSLKEDDPDPARREVSRTYATAEGIRVGASVADVRAAYGQRAVDWPSDAKHWVGIQDVSLPFIPPRDGTGPRAHDGLLVRDGDHALVFLAQDGVVTNIIVSTVDAQGRTFVLQPC